MHNMFQNSILKSEFSILLGFLANHGLLDWPFNCLLCYVIFFLYVSIYLNGVWSCRKKYKKKQWDVSHDNQQD